MKTIVPPAVITPGVLVLAFLAAAVVFIGATSKKCPSCPNDAFSCRQIESIPLDYTIRMDQDSPAELSQWRGEFP